MNFPSRYETWQKERNINQIQTPNSEPGPYPLTFVSYLMIYTPSRRRKANAILICVVCGGSDSSNSKGRVWGYTQV
jgi:hypothetical protein